MSPSVSIFLIPLLPKSLISKDSGQFPFLKESIFSSHTAFIPGILEGQTPLNCLTSKTVSETKLNFFPTPFFFKSFQSKELDKPPIEDPNSYQVLGCFPSSNISLVPEDKFMAD